MYKVTESTKVTVRSSNVHITTTENFCTCGRMDTNSSFYLFSHKPRKQEEPSPLATQRMSLSLTPKCNMRDWNRRYPTLTRPSLGHVTYNQTHDKSASIRWFKYDRDKLWLVYTQIVPVIFEPPCRRKVTDAAYSRKNTPTFRKKLAIIPWRIFYRPVCYRKI
jgi:hypothetical protein